MTTLPTITLNTPSPSGHPWIFSSHIAKPKPSLPPGTVVRIETSKQAFVGFGFWNGHARIALRILSRHQQEPLDEALIATRIDRAVTLRRDILKLDKQSNAWRVIYSEGDGLSGLIVDRYANTLVIEYVAAGMWKWRDLIASQLLKHFPHSHMYHFAQRHVQKQESFDCHANTPPDPIAVNEHGLKFYAAPGSGHKTGFFADQRDNRLRFAQLAQDRHVLDLCCNAGGFGIHALAHGARSATGIDMDEGILTIARKNAEANHVTPQFIHADIFDWLKQAHDQQQSYQVVVLDPAKLTRNPKHIKQALKKYFAMNRLAINVVAPGGLFLTCSCTGLVSTTDFLAMLRRVAIHAQRNLQILHINGAGEDHPVLASAPEGHYLKAVFCRIW